MKLRLSLFVVLFLSALTSQAQSSVYRNDPSYPFIIITSDTVTQAPQFTDKEFHAISTGVQFKINKSDIRPDDKFFTIYNQEILPRINNEHLQLRKVIIRGAASPEGPYEFNKRLGCARADALFAALQKGLTNQYIQTATDIACVTEDYGFLCILMEEAGDKDYQLVKDIYDSCDGDEKCCKKKLMAARKGALWSRLLKEYFPKLRSARLVLWFSEPDKEHAPKVEEPVIDEPVIDEPVIDEPEVIDTPVVVIPPVEEPQQPVGRRELLSIKTNLAEYGAYIPRYGYCPMPNLAIEYYPLHGHVTLGAMIDFPWWQGNTTNHKYFQLRNYTLEGRYYLKSGDVDKIGWNTGGAFTGFYLQAYAHAFIYGIGVMNHEGWKGDGDIGGEGWQGEGFGGGVGFGYVIPLSRNRHWRLELSAQFGAFTSKYDPYVYGCPVEKRDDGLYYYDWILAADKFKKRQYRHNWFGPTRVSIQISYDIIYRKRNKK